jgi:hypothetical protein
VRRFLVVGAFGAILAGTGIGWAIGEVKADPGCPTVMCGSVLPDEQGGVL